MIRSANISHVWKSLAACLALAGSLASQAALADGLVAQWPLDVINGGVTPDAVSTHAMTVVGTPAVGPGQVGDAFTLNGTNTYLLNRHDSARTPGSLPIYTAGAYTISMWVKGPAQTARYLFSEGGTNSNNPIFIIQTGQAAANNAKLDVILRNDAGGAAGTPINHVVSDAVVFDDTWHHFTWVDDNGAVRLYVDAVLDAANFNYTPVGVYTMQNTAIGTLVRAAVATTAIFNGQIDDVKIWERALTEEEVYELVPDVAPTITTGPASVTRALGDWVLFTVAHSGTGPFTYQWFKNGTEIPGATAKSYRLTGLTTANTGEGYSVRVTNAAGSATSGAGTVTVLDDPAPDLRRDLVNYWPLDTIEARDGLLFSEELYSGNDMVLVNFTGIEDVVPGAKSNALGFDFATKYTYRTNGTPIYNATNYTVAMWVKGPFESQNDRRVFSEGSSTDNDPLFTLGTSNETLPTSGSATVFIRNDTAAGTAVNGRRSTRPVFDDTWHHIVWTDANGRGKLYVDGVLDETDYTYVRPALTLDRTALGAVLRATNTFNFLGSIDEVATWKRVLTFTEIQSIYTNTVPAPIAIIPPSIVVAPLPRTSGVFAGDTVTFNVQTSGTVPLTFEWFRNDVAINPTLNPSAATDTLRLTNVVVGDSGSTFYVRVSNSAGNAQTDPVGLNVSAYTPATSGVVLNVDVGLTGSPNPQAGFDEFNLGMNGTNYNGVGLTITGIGAALADRNRVTGAMVANNPPAMSQAQIYNDFIFANSTTDGTGLRLLIERLAPNTKYGVTIWSFDPQSTGARFADWNETTVPEIPQPIAAGYTFDGAILPVNNFDNTVTAILTSSADGKLQIDGLKNGGASFGAFVNAIRLEANPGAQITGAALVGNLLRISVRALFPGQAITIEQRPEVDSGNWTPATIVDTQTVGNITTFDVAMAGGKMFFRAATPAN